jgi:type III secretory pathway component EscV
MIEHETSRRLRTELRLRLGWRDINIFGNVLCWSKPDEIVVLTEYRRRSVGININKRFTFPANTPADEVIDSVILQLTFSQ